jgi:hypothetical protein
MAKQAHSILGAGGELLPTKAMDPLKQLVDDFLRDLGAANKSRHTKKRYDAAFKVAVAFTRLKFL